MLWKNFLKSIFDLIFNGMQEDSLANKANAISQSLVDFKIILYLEAAASNEDNVGYIFTSATFSAQLFATMVPKISLEKM